MSAEEVRQSVEQIERRTLQALERPRRLRAIAELVNEGRPGWDIISDLELAKVLGDLHARGLVERSDMGYWQQVQR